ncbi:hypothetical protein LAZ67_23002411 [Cordylochernes scorpioides]|uniref:Uncharacterized protein n=1 Tax=Cordylochernes scorpioides TaxID=51811 RepID=A0ABY6LR98_9ARAC|nr:hypothetical protein LAZ67_23002411 [Cordylochernes scorpioides]
MDTSNSDVRKSNGKTWRCLDLRGLNKHTMREQFRLPAIEDLLAKICKWIASTIILKFYQSQNITATTKIVKLKGFSFSRFGIPEENLTENGPPYYYKKVKYL